ncbi:MAG: hypothetical protein NZ699_16590 [Roseiflexus sp.]|nr:hypothetical protein [Roseiflexus sp.]MDW8233697.1 hypothetical protein [Roseiflexaceae bacterium]
MIRRSTLACLAIAAITWLVGAIVVYIKLMRHSFDPLISAEIDGYFVYQLAQSLPSLNADLDLPAYRAQRILLPFLAAPFGAFIPWAIIGINLCALATGSYALARIALQHRRSPLIGIVFGLWIGSLFALQLNLTEILAYALVLWGIALYEPHRPAPAAILFGLAVLAKETAVLYPTAFIISHMQTQPWRKQALFGLLSIGHGALWQLMLIALLGQSGLTAAFQAGAPADRMFPFTGLLTTPMRASDFWIVQMLWVFTPSLGATCWGLIALLYGVERFSPASWALLLNGLFVLALPAPSCEYMVHSARIALAVVVALTWAIVRVQRPTIALAWCGFLLAPLAVFSPDAYF